MDPPKEALLKSRILTPAMNSRSISSSVLPVHSGMKNHVNKTLSKQKPPKTKPTLDPRLAYCA